MSNPVGDYQSALKVLHAASRKAEETVKPSVDAGDLLRQGKWKRVVVSNISSGGYPSEIVMGPKKAVGSIDANNWPTALQIHEALIAWHAARNEVMAKWNSIPEDQKIGLASPASSTELY